VDKYIHVSKEKYDVGHQLGPYNTCYYSKKAQDSGLGFVNELLDECKPADACSRTQAVYLFDDIHNAIAYAETAEIDDPKYYVVETEDASGPHPMTLVDGIARNGKSGNNSNAAREYWEPKEEWRFNEYLAKTAVVVDTKKPPELAPGAAGIARNMNDQAQRKTFFS
jgi:hypothetical protein